MFQDVIKVVTIRSFEAPEIHLAFVVARRLYRKFRALEIERTNCVYERSCMNYRINITYSKRASDLSDFLENVVSSYCHRTSVLFYYLLF